MLRLEHTLAHIQRWDERVCLRFNRALRNRALLGTFRGVSRLGDGAFWYLLMLGMLLHSPATVPVVTRMLLVGLVCSALYKLLKHGTSRPRPYQVHASIAASASPPDRFSFPSGHTLHAVAFSVIALAYYPALAPLLVPFTLLVALSRVILGLHYPSDVLAGGLIGGALAFGSFAL